VFGQEDFESMQLLWNTLDVVEAIDTNDDFDTLELLLELRDALLHLWLLQSLVELFWVNSDWKCADSNDLALELDTVGSGREAAGRVSNGLLCVSMYTYRMREQLLRKWRA
jgi:hypothetical protein